MDQTKKTVAKVRDTILKHRMIAPGDLVVVAVSGGPDSICLLDILNRLSSDLGIGLFVAHYDHSLRPGEDETETRLVDHFSKTLNLPFITEKASANGKNTILTEEEARNSRYQFLEKVKARENAHKIAVGHNLNDQAETVIMRILRGSGTSGITGIPPVRDNRIIRPLIDIKREEIEHYLAKHEILYAIDSSNRDKKFLRNRIRLELLPLMLEYQPRLIEHLGNLSNILRQEDGYLDQQAEDYANMELAGVLKDEISVSITSFQRLPYPLRNRVIRVLLKRVGNGLRKIASDHIQAISSLAGSEKPQGILNLPKGIVVTKEYDRLSFLMGKDEETGDFESNLKEQGTVYLKSIDKSIKVTEVSKSMIPEIMDLPNVVYVDAEKIRYPLKVRSYKPGDKFIPLGMKGHRKIKDFFIDLKIPSKIRRIIPIMLNREGVVWICGYRLDDRYKITPTTKKALKMIIS